MSGSSNAGIEGKGWSITLDSGISIDWHDAEEGAGVHAREEQGFFARLQALRPRLERLLATSGVVVDDVAAARVADTAIADLKKTATWPLVVRVHAGDLPRCTLRLRVTQGSHDDVVALCRAVVPLLQDAANPSLSTTRLQSGPLRIAVLGAGGGLGRNVVDAALAAGHRVCALVRDAKRAALPDGVDVVIGDAANVDDVARVADADAVVFCVNPAFSRWSADFPPLLEASLTAVKASGARFVFPANVFVYGKGVKGVLVDEQTVPAPISEHGRVRLAMEQRIAASGVRARLLRLPEFYGENVVTLTAHAFQAVLHEKTVLWPGDVDATVEFVYLRDAARGLVDLAAAADDDDADVEGCFCFPGVQVSARNFVLAIANAAGVSANVRGVPTLALKLGGLIDASLASVADTSHLWTHPILLDGSRFAARFGAVPRTDLSTAMKQTMAWHRARPDLKLQG